MMFQSYKQFFLLFVPAWIGVWVTVVCGVTSIVDMLYGDKISSWQLWGVMFGAIVAVIGFGLIEHIGRHCDENISS